VTSSREAIGAFLNQPEGGLRLVVPYLDVTSIENLENVEDFEPQRVVVCTEGLGLTTHVLGAVVGPLAALGSGVARYTE
jgi:hypothetical protein